MSRPDPTKAIWGSAPWFALVAIAHEDATEELATQYLAAQLLDAAAQETARDPEAAAWAIAAREEARRAAREHQRL